MRGATHARPPVHLWLLLIASMACSGQDAEPARADSAWSITAPAARSVTTQHVKVRSLDDGHVIRGSSATLKRREHGLAVKVRTRGLEPGEAVDVFWAVFNHPAQCRNPNPLTGAPCSPADLFIAAAGGSLHFVGTLTADQDGDLAYSASLETGSTAGCVGDPFPCATLTNPAGAEVHSPMFAPGGGPGRQAAQFQPPGRVRR